MSKCRRCQEMLKTPPEDFVLFWSPTQPTDLDWLRREGERIRLIALAMHADEGHQS